MNDLEKQLDECNVRLYQILNKIADIKLDLLKQHIKKLNDEFFKKEIKEQEDD